MCVCVRECERAYVWVRACVSDHRFIQFTFGNCYPGHINALCATLARKVVPRCACSISANSTNFATLHYVSDCLGRLATASERTSS